MLAKCIARPQPLDCLQPFNRVPVWRQVGRLIPTLSESRCVISIAVIRR
jgi:hypothetical protein